MMRSKAVALGGIAALSSAVLAGCSDDVTADCVKKAPNSDGTYTVVSDSYCNNHVGASYVHYLYLYGGHYNHGRISGGTSIRPADVGISTRSGTVISRGGFGGRGSSGGG